MPVLAGGHPLGVLYVQAGPAPTAGTAELLRYAARVVAVLLSLQEGRGPVDGQFRDELLEDLLISVPAPGICCSGAPAGWASDSISRTSS